MIALQDQPRSIKIALSVLLFLVWTKSTIVDYIYGFLLRFVSPEMSSSMIASVCAICVIILLTQFIKYSRIQDFLFVVVCIGVFLTTYYTHPEYATQLDENLYFTYIVAPTFFVGIILSNIDCERYLYQLSYIGVVAVFFYKMIYGGSSLDRDAEDMANAYALLPFTLMVCIDYINNPKIVKLGVLIFAVMFIFSMGTRGPLMCLGIFGILYLVLKLFKEGVNKLYVAIISAGIVTIVFFKDIMILLSSLMTSFGFSNRIFIKLSEGNILQSDGRDLIQEILFAKVLENPWTGYGVCADRFFIETYSHNLFLELVISFGLPITILITLAIVLYLVKALKGNSMGNCIFILALFSCSFAHLLVSGSLIQSHLFFLFLGYIVGTSRLSKISN